ncbi:unnamed protein product [Urochloa decumbens]|uniref:ALA-interacting subunit n=2 Tax=Urochloa decumbens TaxID=240449 RepID=A0ABC9G3Y6_9POAL
MPCLLLAAMAPAKGEAAGPSSSKDGSAATMKKRNRPQYHPFTQQQLPACKPILAPQTVIPVLLFVGIIFVPMGLGCIAASNRVVEVVYQYETSCVPAYMLDNKVAYIQNPSIDKTCTRILKVPKDMKQPIYIYYQLDKFYQNHRRYVKSRNDKQLRSPEEVNNTQYCKPEATHHGNPVVPCGLVAWSLFNDTYSFTRGNEALMVHKRGISWRSEREDIFGNRVFPRNFQNGALIGGGTLDPRIPLSRQEDLIVWMRTAALPTFRKLYGRIEVDLHADEMITVTLQNNYNTYSFGGKKALVLSTAGVLGGKNGFLGRGYVVVGLSCLALAALLTLLCLVFPLKEEHLALQYPLSRPAR